MKFLKKASFKDICGLTGKSQFHYYEDVSARYKEFELYLTREDLKSLLDDTELSSMEEGCWKKMTEVLRKNGAEITAIHCPESLFITRNEKEGEMSGNYLSLCEVMRDEDSMKVFIQVINLADKISKEQSQGIDQEYTEEVDEEEQQKPQKAKGEIIIVLHEGCEVGCRNNRGNNELYCGNLEAGKVSERIIKAIGNTKFDSNIKIAIENITPFYSDPGNVEQIGKNCGWKQGNQLCCAKFFKEINEKLKEKLKERNLEFGACIDFCHILVSSVLKGNKKEKSEAIEEFFSQDQMDYGEHIFLYHVSNYGKDLSHGRLFSFEDESDKKAIEQIITKCNEHPAPITFEMADGEDPEKAAFNYDNIMFYFSNKHIFGKFGELLNEDCNKELKEFFDSLFLIYTYDKEFVYEITNALWQVKQIILKNTYIPEGTSNLKDLFISEKEERIFGVDFDKSDINLSLARLKAYVYYTRFCNLGNFLAKEYYNVELDSCIWDNVPKEKENLAEDFGLAMKYFIFNDKIHQCVYTGIQYRFLIDFLPKKESFVRLNDGINSYNFNKMDFKGKDDIKKILEGIRKHINGKVDNKWAFYSVGKNFGQCLFKYYNSEHEDWSIQLYENQAINYVNYDRKRYSIPAFIQWVLSGNQFEACNDWNMSLDLSRFSDGRDGNDTDSLVGFLHILTGGEISREKVASVSDGEILFTKLPQKYAEYRLSREEGAILKKIILGLRGRKNNALPCTINFVEKLSEKGINKLSEDKEKLKKAITNVNINKEHDIWKILKFVLENNFDISVKSKELGTLDGNDRIYYKNMNESIECIWTEG